MTEQAVRAFVERMKDDQEFRDRVMGAGSTEERLGIARAEGIECTAEEIAALQADLEEAGLEAVVGGHLPGCAQPQDGLAMIVY